ncbi:MAG: methyltransferase domain-containing protein [Ignavibacteriales bacterium]|nr:methyltransferase domain-containing protein [Ignavibacteriales bacterium]
MSTSQHLDDPRTNDNRKYDYSGHTDSERYEYPIIVEMVKQGSSVIDLGCGNGALLARLKNEKQIIETGLEISESGVRICKERGLNVQFGAIDEHLPFNDNAFDYAVCNVTIQMVMYPEVLLREMKRVAQYQIVSFPNFAFWRNRIDLFFNGRMPKRMLFEYKWYSTGHIHQLSFEDFDELLEDIGGFRVVECRLERSSNPIKDRLLQDFPNLFQLVPVFLLEKT